LISVLDLGVNAGDHPRPRANAHHPRANGHHPYYLHLYYRPYFYCFYYFCCC
jgi:hypothetical protein